jgi:hypothetical protein
MAAERGAEAKAIVGVKSFNEAAAKWPRKVPPAGARHRARGCFNEAAAKWPRKAARSGKVSDRPAIASMRPRPNGRGKFPTPRFAAWANIASMRPRPNGRGKRGTLRRPHAAPRASMRPRPNGRGKGPGQRLLVPRQDHASMRPRPNGRGKRAARRTRRYRARGFNEAAAKWPRKGADPRRAAPVGRRLQ